MEVEKVYSSMFFSSTICDVILQEQKDKM